MKKLLLSTLIVLATLNPAWAQSLAYFGQTPSSYHSPTDYGNNTATGNYVQSGDAKIYYEVYGQGKPIVVLHGGLVGSPAEMGQFIDKLQTNHQVIVVSTRGHGKSEVGKVLPTFTQKANDIAQVIKTVGVKQPVDLLGFSDGAYTALTFASAYPQLTHKVVAIGAGEWKKGFVQGGRDPNGTFADIQKLDPVYWQQQQTIRPQPKQTAQWISTANQVYNHTEISNQVFNRVKAPVLLVVGEDDKNAPLDTVITAYKMLPHADLAVIPNAPHPVFTVNFNSAWDCIEPFLQQ